MAGLFENSAKRIERAIMHAKNISRQWNGLIDPTKYETCIERRGPRQFIAKAVIDVAPSHDMSLELGEFFYQLRAALDGVFWEASILQEGADPPANETRVEFPLYPSEVAFKRSVAWNGSFPQELKEWFEAIQPYNVGKSSKANLNELGRRLSILHDYARKDRHRRLHFIAAALTRLETEFWATPNNLLTNVTPLTCNFLDNEFDFLSFSAAITDAEATRLRLNVGMTVEVTVADLPGLVGQEVLNELERVMLAVRHVVDVFENGHER